MCEVGYVQQYNVPPLSLSRNPKTLLIVEKYVVNINKP